MLLTDIEMHTKDSIREIESLENKILKFIELFETDVVAGCSKDDDSDMLLYEWGGPYSWNNSKVISLVRQFTVSDDDGNYEGMKQLRLDFSFSPDVDIGESGNKWLERETIAGFQAFVLASEAYIKAKDEPLLKSEVYLDEV